MAQAWPECRNGGVHAGGGGCAATSDASAVATLLDALPLGVLLLDTSEAGGWVVAHANRAAAALLGRGEQIPPGSRLEALLGGRVQHWVPLLRGAVAGIEVAGLCPGQALALSRFEPAPGQLGVMLEDVSARRVQVDEQIANARHAAESAAAAKRAFLANIRHELRTPLNGLLGMLDLALAGELAPEQRELLQIAQQSGDGLHALVSAVLDIALIEADALELAPGPFDLRALVDRVARNHSQVAAGRGQVIECCIDAQLAERVDGDAERIAQVLANLLDNAVKFSDHGSITLRVGPCPASPADARGQWVRFEVSDQGIGIAEEHWRRIFRPFFLIDPSSTRSHGGCGLGLALCHGLVGLMSGRIGVESVVGQGSLFWFEVPLGCAQALPRAARADDAGLPTTGMPTQAIGQGRRLLLVEDHPVNRILATRVAESAGFTVVAVTDGVAALERLVESAFDVVLMDCQMPRMDGLEATRRLRAREAAHGAARVPVLALTAHASAHERAACMAAGMDDFMGKPYSPAELLAMIARHVSRIEPPPAVPDGANPAASAAHEQAALGAVHAGLTAGGAGSAGGQTVQCARESYETALDGEAEDFSRIDMATLQELRDALGDDLVEIVDYFLSQLDAQLASLADALSAGDGAEAGRQAHALKGSAANLGLAGLADVAAQIERAGKAGKLEAARASGRQVERCAAQTVRRLAELGYPATAT